MLVGMWRCAMGMVRRSLGILLALVLLVGMVPVSARAAYSTENDLVIIGSAPEQAEVMAASDVEYLTDVEEAAAVLREAMVNREETVTIYFAAPASQEFGDVTDSIISAAEAHTGNPKEGDYLAKQQGGIYTRGSYYPGSEINKYVLTFEIEYYTTAEQEAQVDAAVAELLGSLGLEGLSDYEKVCAVYQWMVTHISYDNDHLGDSTYKLQYTAYGALIDGTSVCQGYALLLYRLMLELGIDCRVISGTGNGGGHAWNIVKLGGKYYDLDATWDTSWYNVLGRYEYFLRCDANFGDHVRGAAFASEDFYAAYPMGETDYDPTAEPQWTPGDINGDGDVNNKDVTRLFQYLSEWDVDADENALDVNGDGTVNNKDLTRLFQYLSGWDVEIE